MLGAIIMLSIALDTLLVDFMNFNYFIVSFLLLVGELFVEANTAYY